MNEAMLEKSFINLYDQFLKLNMHIQKSYPKDKPMKLILENMVFVFEDIAEHYYYEELSRVRENDNDDNKNPH
ncbi:MAG: hypothetical protein Unbinned834contig1000_45 [Prokaryotic dsDNA virus sp.]|nr:MAG: hypothetical protein Unbinned834contig1000_45 [Prokaryotic dsDNA virus sp.]|tara:strand:+ start:222 stop:440 length:219 start_codon:yes stop_codon:yes gene_type:complete